MLRRKALCVSSVVHTLRYHRVAAIGQSRKTPHKYHWYIFLWRIVKSLIVRFIIHKPSSNAHKICDFKRSCKLLTILNITSHAGCFPVHCENSRSYFFMHVIIDAWVPVCIHLTVCFPKVLQGETIQTRFLYKLISKECLFFSFCESLHFVSLKSNKETMVVHTVPFTLHTD